MQSNDAQLTPVRALLSLAAAAAIVLLIPFAILIVGAPVALAIRLVVEALAWLSRAVAG